MRVSHSLRGFVVCWFRCVWYIVDLIVVCAYLCMRQVHIVICLLDKLFVFIYSSVWVFS